MTVTNPPEITADNVATLFPEVDTSLARNVLPTATNTGAGDGAELEGYDEEQVRLMDEVCIVVDNNDRPIGSASKKLCMSNVQLHIAFFCLERGGSNYGFLGARPLDDQH